MVQVLAKIVRQFGSHSETSTTSSLNLKSYTTTTMSQSGMFVLVQFVCFDSSKVYGFVMSALPSVPCVIVVLLYCYLPHTAYTRRFADRCRLKLVLRHVSVRRSYGYVHFNGGDLA